jgi:hypothetical protein
MLRVIFWVVPRRVVLIDVSEHCVCFIFIDVWMWSESLHIHTPMKMEQTQCSEMSVIKHHTPGNNPKDYTQYLSSVYWVTILLHISGLLVAHHQEVAMYVCDSWCVLYILVDCHGGLCGMCSIPSMPADSRLRLRHIPAVTYTLLPLDDGLLASLKYVEV